MCHRIKLFLSYIYGLFAMLIFSKNTYLPIICYHSVNRLNHQDACPIKPEDFEKQMLYLKKHYEVVFVDEIISSQKKGDRPRVAITFDDGFIDNYTNVFPIIKKLKLPISIFVVTDFIYGKCHLINHSEWSALTWDCLKEMQKSSLVRIEAHTVTHTNLADINDINVKDEIQESRNVIEKELKSTPKCFAYPNGQGHHFNNNAIEYVKNAGFDIALTTLFSTRQNLRKPYLLNRILISRHDSISIFVRKLEGFYDYIYWWHKLKFWWSRC